MTPRYLVLHNGSGQGLERDARVLARALDLVAATRGERCETTVIAGLPDLETPAVDGRYQAAFHLELVFHRPWLTDPRRVERHVLVPNPEFLRPEMEEDGRPLGLREVLCKTALTREIVARDFPRWRPTLVGWDSVDMLGEDAGRSWDRCLHVKGQSFLKQSQLVVDCWLAHPELPPLVVTSVPQPDRFGGGLRLPGSFQVADNLTFIQRPLPEEEIRELMNRNAIHICPSLCEGFGHYINEARSTGACIVTTDAPPMNELVDESGGELVPVERSEPLRSSRLHHVSAGELARRVRRLVDRPLDEKRRMGAINRRRYLEDGRRFVRRLAELLAAQG